MPTTSEPVHPLDQPTAGELTPHPRADVLPPPPPSEICQALGIEHLEIEWLAGDGSDRCYYRVRSTELHEPVVLMQLSGTDAKALSEGGYDWIAVANLLAAQNVPVPALIATMPKFAALLIEDYGNLMLETEIKRLAENGKFSEIEALYEPCLDVLTKFMTIDRSRAHVWQTRQFDQERFVWELNFFKEFYLEAVLNIHLTPEEYRHFIIDAKALSKFITQHADFFVHRDFHSRNIMLHCDQPAIIDFQDARLGPATYDLVSLAFDAYVPLDYDMRLNLLKDGLKKIGAATGDLASLEQEWRAMLLQRQLKAIGSFGYLTVRKNRGNYLQYVRPALGLLLHAGVRDSRWPFISEPLLHKMELALT